MATKFVILAALITIASARYDSARDSQSQRTASYEWAAMSNVNENFANIYNTYFFADKYSQSLTWNIEFIQDLPDLTVDLQVFAQNKKGRWQQIQDTRDVSSCDDNDDSSEIVSAYTALLGTQFAGTDSQINQNSQSQRTQAQRVQASKFFSNRHSQEDRSQENRSQEGGNHRGQTQRGHSNRGHSNRGQSHRGQSHRGQSHRGQSHRGNVQRGNSHRGHSDFIEEMESQEQQSQQQQSQEQNWQGWQSEEQQSQEQNWDEQDQQSSGNDQATCSVQQGVFNTDSFKPQPHEISPLIISGRQLVQYRFKFDGELVFNAVFMVNIREW